jgi:hypothetical protein
MDIAQVLRFLELKKVPTGAENLPNISHIASRPLLLKDYLML